MKIHKKDNSARPVVSMINTPEYNLAEFLDKLTKPHLPKQYILDSTSHFTHKLIKKQFSFNEKQVMVKYNQSLVSLATHSQSRLNSFQTVKTLFMHCFTCTSRIHLFSRLCPIFGRRLAPNNDTQ